MGGALITLGFLVTRIAAGSLAKANSPKRKKSKKGHLQDMNLYDLAKMCATPLGGSCGPS